MTVIIEKTGGIDVPTYDIMVDYDDVIVPWVEPVHNQCVADGITNGRLYSSWHMWEDYGCTKEAWMESVMRATENGLYIDTEPFPGAVAAMNSLLWRGHRVHIVTARGTNWGNIESRDRIRNWTRLALAKFGIGHTTLTFNKDKVSAQANLGVTFDYAIDDGAHNYELLNEAGVPVWLQTQRHNADLEVQRRIESLWDFAQMINRDQTVSASLISDSAAVATIGAYVL